MFGMEAVQVWCISLVHAKQVCLKRQGLHRMYLGRGRTYVNIVILTNVVPCRLPHKLLPLKDLFANKRIFGLSHLLLLLIRLPKSMQGNVSSSGAHHEG